MGAMKTQLAPMDAAEATRIWVGGDDVDTSETINVARGRAPVEGVMDSDVPTQSLGEKCRVGDLHFACFVGKEVVKERAPLWQLGAMGKV